MSIIIPNTDEFEKKKKIFAESGADKIHIVSDFDRTLTKCFAGDKKINSLMAQFRDKKYISEDYAKKAHELFEKYHPIEINPNISFEEKKKQMADWWKEHFELLVKSGLNERILDDFVENTEIYFREGVLEFLDILKNKNIPLIIISSSGLGTLIPKFLEKESKLYENIFAVSNVFEFDEKGNFVKVKEPIIHSLNKEESSLPDYVFEKIKDRKNVILLGDNLEDVQMISGFEYENLIKIGFLDENIEENLDVYKKTFDVIITEDGDFEFVNNLIIYLYK